MAMPGDPNLAERPWLDEQAKPFIEIRGVTKRFGDFVAVDNVSLKIYRGELFALLGGSGCGKTTLLRMLAGFETPSEGVIKIDNVDMAATPPYERPVNMMFQSYALFPHMTVEKNVAYGLKREGVAAPEIRDRVGAMLDLVQLGRFAKRKPHQLSGGQRQRVALARALIKQPKVLLLDEPLGALDKKLREQTQFELMNIQDQLGVTFVVVTHDQEEAMTLASRIAVMNQGEIVQVGEPDEIYERPSSRFTADFIGSINMFEAEVDPAGANGPTVTCADLGTALKIAPDSGHAAGAAVCLAVRPEKIMIAREAPGNDQVNVVPGKVQGLAYTGNLSIYRVETGPGRVVMVTTANRSRTTDRAVDWDDEVYLSWAPDDAIVLTE